MVKRFIFTILFALTFSGMMFAQSADTVHVPALDENGDPYFDSLIEYIVADTNNQGEQQHLVYKLERNSFYIINKAVTLRNEVEIVADPPAEGNPPPKIMSNINEDGGTSTGSLIITFADITLKNLWLSGIDLGAVNHGWGNRGALLVNDSLVTVTIDGLWCDWNSWSAFGTTQPHTSWYINNLHARNEQNEGDQWTTFLFFMEGGGVLDNFVITNSSYFQSNSFFLFPPSVVQNLVVDHCTFVNTYKWPFHQTQWLNAQFTNNIFYNTGALSLTPAEAESQDPEGLMYGLINVDTLFANSIDTVVAGPYTIAENERQVDVRSNIWYYSQEIQDYLAAHDSVMAPVFMNERTQAMFDNDEVWPGLVVEDTYNVDPEFDDFEGLSEAVGLLAQACTDIRAGNTHAWDWDGDMDTDPDFYKLLIQYPTAEDFRSYSGLLGTDGLPIGDLSYYPGITSVEDEIGVVPTAFELEQNYPNPFNPTTKISFNLNKAGNVQLAVYNLLGQRVRTLVNDTKTAGSYSVVWNGKNDAGMKVPSGVYFYRLEQGSNQMVKKMMMLK